MRKLISRQVLIALLALGLAAAEAFADHHVLKTLDEAKWSTAPPMLPPGAKMEVLSGDPTSESMFSIRLKFPANYRIPAHSHPQDEHVSVLSGTLFMGMGEKFDTKASKALEVGGFGLMPAGENHFAYTKEETVILLYGHGPVEFDYVNPNDDPRNSSE